METHKVPHKLKIERGDELLHQAAQYVAQEQYKEAQPLLESAIEIIQQNEGDMNGKTACYIFLNLAYVYHHLKNSPGADENYVRAISSLETLYGPQFRDRGVALLNYAEFLVNEKRLEEGISAVTSSISILRKHHQKDSFLAAALSNHAVYLCILEKYREAKAPCAEALAIFSRELGRNNDYTRTTFAHMYKILKNLDLKEEISDLEADWESIDKSELKGLSDKELADIAENFLHTVKQAEAKANPPGPTKGSKFYLKELNDFFGDFKNKDTGIDLSDPAFTPILNQEIDAIKMGNEARSTLAIKNKQKREKIIQERTASVEEEKQLHYQKETRKVELEDWKILSKDEKSVIESTLDELHYVIEDLQDKDDEDTEDSQQINDKVDDKVDDISAIDLDKDELDMLDEEDDDPVKDLKPK